MCHLVREPKAFAGDSADASVPPRQGLRPRWAAAIAAVFLGGVALAAWVAPPSAPAKDAKPVAAVPAAASFVAPTATDVERGMLPVDDGVPSASVKAGGDCHHAL